MVTYHHPHLAQQSQKPQHEQSNKQKPQKFSLRNTVFYVRREFHTFPVTGTLQTPDANWLLYALLDTAAGCVSAPRGEGPRTSTSTYSEGEVYRKKKQHQNRRG